MPLQTTTEAVKAFWESNPLCAAAIPHPWGTPQYFADYDRLREANESVDFSRDLHEYPQFAGRRVLDVGSGNGYVLSRYARAGAEVHGVDLTETGIALCRKRFELLGLKGDFRVADAQALPFADNYFDCVCSMGVLHHVPDTEKAVSEVFRVLRPGGRLIVMFYHRNSALYRLRFPQMRRRTGKSIQQLVDEVDGVGNPKGDVYSRAELRRLLGRFASLRLFVGCLEPAMVPGIGPFLPPWALRWLGRRWGWFLYAKAEKP